MPIDVKFLDESDRSVIVITYRERWTWTEWRNVVTGFVEEHGELSYPFSIIADHRPTKHLALGILDVAKTADETDFFANIDKIALIGAPYFLNMLFKIFERIYPQAASHYFFCDDFDEALNIIKSE